MPRIKAIIQFWKSNSISMVIIGWFHSPDMIKQSIITKIVNIIKINFGEIDVSIDP